MSVRAGLPNPLLHAQRHLTACGLCEHRCGANRRAGETGPCLASQEARVFRHRVEYGEELALIPSHLFYLSGCDLRCKFCIAEVNAFNPRIGTTLTVGFLREAIRWGRDRGARNVQWVGGEPTIHIPAILEAMAGVADLPPVVWKSDFYGTPAAFQLLDGTVDVYVADFKFGNNVCAARLASVERYVETVERNLRIAANQGDLIIRHLLLPDHFECCYRPIVEWLAEHMPDVKFSLRDGYLPRWQAHRYDDLCRPTDPALVRAARRLAGEYRLNLVT